MFTDGEGLDGVFSVLAIGLTAVLLAAVGIGIGLGVLLTPHDGSLISIALTRRTGLATFAGRR